jgi:hypothetical protein
MHDPLVGNLINVLVTEFNYEHVFIQIVVELEGYV